MTTTKKVDAESESGDEVVIVEADPGETQGMTRDRAYKLTQLLKHHEFFEANALSRVWVWSTHLGCEYIENLGARMVQ